MNDLKDDGNWTFMDDNQVNFAPDLTCKCGSWNIYLHSQYIFPSHIPFLYLDITKENKYPQYTRNTTLGDYWWFLWGPDFLRNYTQLKEVCRDINGSVANIVSQEINDVITASIKVSTVFTFISNHARKFFK